MSTEVSMERLVRTYLAANGDEDVQEVVSAIESGSSTVLLLVRALGEPLTSTEDAVRTRGLNLLSEVLTRIPKEKLSEQATRVLTKFYIDKLEDLHVIVPALKGILSLESFSHFGDEEAVKVFEALVQNIKMRAHVQATRFIVFMIIDALLKHRRDALKSLGNVFIGGYIELANGEKDPRNLLQAFSIDRVILTEFETKSKIDDLFDITFCYFPISWKPPAGDPYGISTDDLRNALRQCLSATSLFGPLAMPTFLEKLSATVGAAKIDTLQSMTACFPIYGQTALQPFAQKTWDALRMEIFQPLNDETQDYSLKTLISFIQTSYPSTDAQLDGIAVEITKECIGLLKEPERDQAKHAIKTLGALLESSPAVAKHACGQSLDTLLRLFRDPSAGSARGAVMDAITGLLSSLMRAAADGLYDVSEVLASKKDELVSCFVSSIRSSSLRQNALNAILEITQIAGLITTEEITFMCQACTEILLEESSQETQETLLQVLKQFSRNAPKALEETCLPLLFAQLPDEAPALEADEKREHYWRILSALQSLCLEPVLFQVLVVRLVTKLDIICSLKLDDSPEALIETIQSKIHAKHNDFAKYLDQLVPRLFSIFLRAALSPSSVRQIPCNTILILDASNIVNLLTQTASSTEQARFVTSLFHAYFNGTYTQIAYDAVRIPKDVPFTPFATDASSKSKDLVPILCGAIIGLRKEVDLSIDIPTAMVKRFAEWCLSTADSALQRDAVLRALSTLINKRLEDITPFMNETLPSYGNDVLLNPTVSLPRRLVCLELWVWVGRALLVRSDDSIRTLVDDLFDLFPDSNIAYDAALAIGRISQGGVDVLTKENHATIRFLHMQKFFNLLIPTLITGAKDTSDTTRQTLYLAALAAVVINIPHAVLSQVLPSILPLLFRCLQLSDAGLRANVAEVFAAIAADDVLASTSLTEHSPSLIKALLANSVPVAGEPTSVRLRVAALKSLAAIPAAIRYDVLHPLKPTVISQLGKAVDDHKRSVRKEAVEARAKWYRYHG